MEVRQRSAGGFGCA